MQFAHSDSFGSAAISRRPRRAPPALGVPARRQSAMDEIAFEAALAGSRPPGARRARSRPGRPRCRRSRRGLSPAGRGDAQLGAIGGWKVAAVTPAQRESLGVPSPIGAPLLSRGCTTSAPPPGSTSRLHRREARMRVRLRARTRPATAAGAPVCARGGRRGDLAIRIAVEIVDSRLPRGLGALAELSDAFNNGAFVAGPRSPTGTGSTWRARRWC